MKRKIRVWDLPTRLFHWSLVIAVSGALVTHYVGEGAIEWHFRFGHGALALVLFRVLWGLIGPRYARFASFVHSPARILAYVRGKPWPDATTGTSSHPVGHNPLGGLSVLAMLAVVLLQASSGLFANDDIATEGPLAHLVDKALSDRLTWLHAQVTAKVIYGLIGLHVLAIAYHRVRKKTDLVTPMLTGDQQVDSDVPPASDSTAMRAMAALALSVCALGVYGLAHW